MENQYDLPRNHLLTRWEKLYLRAGICLALSGPIQLMLFYTLMLQQNFDVIFAFPITCFLIWAIPSSIAYSIVFWIAAGSRKNYNEMCETLGITRFFLFAFHAGVMMICRIIFITLARAWLNTDFRLNTPYIFWE